MHWYLANVCDFGDVMYGRLEIPSQNKHKHSDIEIGWGSFDSCAKSINKIVWKMMKLGPSQSDDEPNEKSSQQSNCRLLRTERSIRASGILSSNHRVR